jgi:molybdopterin synthase sulfur carrier subunit
MAVVRLRAPLSELAGGRRELQLEAATVRDVLRVLEHEHPAITGWTLDEQKTIREHVNVFVNGEKGREETALRADDFIHVSPRSAEVRNSHDRASGRHRLVATRAKRR